MEEHSTEGTASGSVALGGLSAPKLLCLTAGSTSPHDAVIDFWEVQYDHKSSGIYSGSFWLGIHVS